MLPDYAWICVSRFSFMLVNKLFYIRQQKSRSKVLKWLFRCGSDSAITLIQWTLNTDSITFIKQYFYDTGTIRKQKLPLSVPITLPDIYIKI